MDRADLLFIAAGVVVVVVVGQLLRYTGRRYVAGAGGAGNNVGGVAALLSVVFHLITLGITALIAVLPVDEPTGFLFRLGILLLAVGLVYGIFVGVLARRREVAITEAAVTEHPTNNENPSVPSHSPSYLPPSGLPRSGDGT